MWATRRPALKFASIRIRPPTSAVFTAVSSRAFSSTPPLSSSSSFLSRLSTVGNAIKELFLPPPCPPPWVPAPPVPEPISDVAFNQLRPLEQVQHALALPVPTKAPPIRDYRLSAVLFGGQASRLLSEQDMREVYSVFHPEKLEFGGDRLWSQVIAETLLVLLPSEILKDGQTPYLGHLDVMTSLLATNAEAAKLAKRFKLVDNIPPDAYYKQFADRFEAYIQALYILEGRRALLEFLVPLVREAYFQEAQYAALPPLDPTFLKPPADGPAVAKTPSSSFEATKARYHAQMAEDFSPKPGALAKLDPPAQQALRFKNQQEADLLLISRLSELDIPFVYRWQSTYYLFSMAGLKVPVTYRYSKVKKAQVHDESLIRSILKPDLPSTYRPYSARPSNAQDTPDDRAETVVPSEQLEEDVVGDLDKRGIKKQLAIAPDYSPKSDEIAKQNHGYGLLKFSNEVEAAKQLIPTLIARDISFSYRWDSGLCWFSMAGLSTVLSFPAKKSKSGELEDVLIEKLRPNKQPPPSPHNFLVFPSRELAVKRLFNELTRLGLKNTFRTDKQQAVLEVPGWSTIVTVQIKKGSKPVPQRRAILRKMIVNACIVKGLIKIDPSTTPIPDEHKIGVDSSSRLHLPHETSTSTSSEPPSSHDPPVSGSPPPSPPSLPLLPDSPQPSIVSPSSAASTEQPLSFSSDLAAPSYLDGISSSLSDPPPPPMRNASSTGVNYHELVAKLHREVESLESNETNSIPTSNSDGVEPAPPSEADDAVVESTVSGTAADADAQEAPTAGATSSHEPASPPSDPIQPFDIDDRKLAEEGSSKVAEEPHTEAKRVETTPTTAKLDAARVDEMVTLLETIGEEIAARVEDHAVQTDGQVLILSQYGLVSCDPPRWQYRTSASLVARFALDGSDLAKHEVHLTLTVDEHPALSGVGATLSKAFRDLINRGRHRGIFKHPITRDGTTYYFHDTQAQGLPLPEGAQANAALASRIRTFARQGLIDLSLTRRIIVGHVDVRASGKFDFATLVYIEALSRLVKEGFISYEYGTLSRTGSIKHGITLSVRPTFPSSSHSSPSPPLGPSSSARSAASPTSTSPVTDKSATVELIGTLHSRLVSSKVEPDQVEEPSKRKPVDKLTKPTKAGFDGSEAAQGRSGSEEQESTSTKQYGLISHDPPRWNYPSYRVAMSRFSRDASETIRGKHEVELHLPGQPSVHGDGESSDHAHLSAIRAGRPLGIFDKPIQRDGELHYFSHEQRLGKPWPKNVKADRRLAGRLHTLSRSGCLAFKVMQTLEIPDRLRIIVEGDYKGHYGERLTLSAILNVLIDRGFVKVEDGRRPSVNLDEEGYKVTITTPSSLDSTSSSPSSSGSTTSSPFPPSPTAGSTFDPLAFSAGLTAASCDEPPAPSSCSSSAASPFETASATDPSSSPTKSPREAKGDAALLDRADSVQSVEEKKEDGGEERVEARSEKPRGGKAKQRSSGADGEEERLEVKRAVELTAGEGEK
ncbi:hypothetical protein JCM8547_002549 [Rhodosporidiobolus lusitaniae]